MKTSLQELIEYEKQLIDSNGDVLSAYAILQFVMKKAKSLIEKEKQDLIEAYNNGVDNTSWDSFEEAYDILITAEDYYKQTFEQ